MRERAFAGGFYYSPYDLSGGGDPLPPFLEAKPYHAFEKPSYDKVNNEKLRKYLETYETAKSESRQLWPVESGMLAPAIYKPLGFREEEARAARAFIGILNTLGVVCPSKFRIEYGLSERVARYYTPDEARAIAAIKGLVTIKYPGKIAGDYGVLTFAEVQETVRDVKEILGEDPRNELIHAPVMPGEKKRKSKPKSHVIEPYDVSMDREDPISSNERYQTIRIDSLRDLLMNAEEKIVSKIPSDKYPISFSGNAYKLLADMSRCGISIPYDNASRLLTYIRDYGILRIFTAPYIGSRKHAVLSRNSLRAMVVLAYYIGFTYKGQVRKLVKRALNDIGKEHELRNFIRYPLEESEETVVFETQSPRA